MSMDPADRMLADPLLLPLPAAAKQVLAGVTDYRGRPVTRGTSGGWRSALFVVGMYVCLFVCFVHGSHPLPSQ